MEFTTTCAAETQNLARRLGELASPRTLILLYGDLGAGKTSFVQGLAQGLDVAANVNSPTFTIIREYRGRLPLSHFDLYRLDDPDEVWELGLEEYVAAAGVVAIEWPQIAEELLPPERLGIHIQHLGEDRRRLRLEPRGDRHRKLAEELMSDVNLGS
ncbi:MAG: tRNA (adenosine(37)-N6)-threonylcarbamoyltransferase complex ATPase subunit type 1 TsaE [Firmicutes bacterium]|nr:tRNA (adenosine(37)-N6)-threonylcarbamoyltransferase complex ATPase subunit type 1 TsaE [Bacillota bacterium]